MRLKHIYLAACLLTGSVTSNAQLTGLYSTAYSWTEKPVLHKMPEKFKDASAVYLRDDRIFEYKFEDKKMVQYNHVYKLIKVEIGRAHV